MVFALFAAASVQEVHASKEEETFFVAQKAYNDGFYEVALKYFEDFVKNYPNSKFITKANIYRARCLMNMDKYFDAHDILQGLIKTDVKVAELSEIYYLLGEINFRGKDYKMAVTHYNQVIDNFKETDFFGPSLYSRAWIEYLQKDFGKAKEDFLKAKDILDDNAALQDIYMKLGEIFFESKDLAALDNLIAEYKEKFEVQPFLDYFMFYKGVILSDKSKYTEAKAIFDSLKDSSDEGIRDNALFRSALLSLKSENEKEVRGALDQLKSEILKNLLEGHLAFRKEDYNEALKFYDSLCGLEDLSPQIRSEACLGKANALYNLGRLKDAVFWYNELIGKFKGFPQIISRARYNLGWTYLRLQDFKKAIGEFQKISQETDDPLVKISVECHIADALQDSERFDEALEAYDEIIKKYPNTLYTDYIQFQIGNTFLKMGKLEEAIIAFRFIQDKYPNSSFLDESLYSMGLAFFIAKDFASAKDVLDEFPDKFKDSSLRLEALYLLSQVYLNIKDYTNQQKILQEIINTCPFERELVQESVFDKAWSMYVEGKKKDAVKYLESFIPRLSPEKQQEAFFWVAQFYAQERDYKEAQKFYTKTLENCKNKSLCAESLFSLGVIFKEKNDFAEAKKYFEELLNKYPQEQISLKTAFVLIDIYVEEKNMEKANEMFLRLDQDFPQHSSEVMLKKAEAMRRMGKLDEASAIYSEIDKNFQIDSPDIYFEWANLLEDSRKTDEAMNIYFKITYLFEGNKDILFKTYLRIAQIYTEKEDLDNAIKIYEKISQLGQDYQKVAEEKIEELTHSR